MRAFRPALITLALLAFVTAVLAQGAALGAVPEGYLEWTRLNAQRNFIPSAHASPKDVYVNDVGADAALTRTFPFPEGTVLVKEITDADALTVSVLALMRKVAGFDPDNGDWQYAMLQRNGDGTFDGDWVPAGHDMHMMCVGCHTAAADRDYAFLTYID
jgi:hypothetical protein